MFGYDTRGTATIYQVFSCYYLILILGIIVDFTVQLYLVLPFVTLGMFMILIQ